MTAQLIMMAASALFGSFFGGLSVWFWRSKDARKKRDLRLSNIETQQAVINAQIVPINAALQALLVKQLTHYHTPKVDRLLAKLGNIDTGVTATITEEEEKELILALEERTKDMAPEISDNERDAAFILPTVIHMVRREAKEVAAGVQFMSIQLVGSLPTGELPH